MGLLYKDKMNIQCEILYAYIGNTNYNPYTIDEEIGIGDYKYHSRIMAEMEEMIGVQVSWWHQQTSVVRHLGILIRLEVEHV